ncbi:MAG: hypothetical protein JWQ20_145 [Conexibacter sp.]|nr:hypothetical protein [Conexibacter sp.]
MGLLDDAIREHLDLKRRRGADPSEISREEHEALGPVRREEPAADDQAAPADGPYADEAMSGGNGGHAALDEPAAAYGDDPGAYDEPAYHEPAAEYEPPAPSEPPRTQVDPHAEPAGETATPPHGDPLLHQQTREFSSHELGEALGESEPRPTTARDSDGREVRTGDAGADGQDEDVLEDTPDFLQETPEHDRLWFEQKPPKDFDF